MTPPKGRVRTDRTTVSTSDFAKEIFRLESEGGQESVNILVHGDSNAGKTSLAATCPGRVFWLVCEPGYKVASRRGAQGHGRRIADAGMAWAALEWLEAKSERTRKPRYGSLDWLVLDGVSNMQDRFRLAYAAEAFDASEGQSKRARAHRNLPDRPDYFNTQNFFRSFMPRLVEMPVNLLVTAHSYRTDRVENYEVVIFPGFQGKVTELANAMSGLMDITAFMSARSLTDGKENTVRRRLWFDQPDQNPEIHYIVGEKYGTLGRYIEDPTIPKLMEKMEGTHA